MVAFRNSQEKQLKGLGETPWVPFRQHMVFAANASLARPTLNWSGPQKSDDIATLHGIIWVLDSNQLALARSYDVISKLPSLTDQEIEDRSKSDVLVQSLAVIRLLWSAIQLIARRIGKLSFALLEISTVALALCAFMVYIIDWSKPKDVGVPIYVDTDTVEGCIYLRFTTSRLLYAPKRCAPSPRGRIPKKGH
ncbi:MAG: hypothetical protein Q9170_003061 [Blastenia crenularia]